MERMELDWFFHAVFAMLGATCHLVMGQVFLHVPEPYMDEIFHIPQVQAFCKGNFTQWDPMITTLPGLYMFTVGLLKPLNFFNSTDLCISVYYLRYINVIFSLCILYVASLISKHKLMQSSVDPYYKSVCKVATMEGLLVTTHPVLFFFTFLYYTDQGSVFFVLLCYLFHLYHSHKLAAFFGACAVLFRQTNVVWVVFVAVSAALPLLCGTKETKGRKIVNEDEFFSGFTKKLSSVLRPVLSFNIKPLLSFGFEVLWLVWPYVSVVACFGSFVLWNGSIVVGAKDDHQVGLHVVQVFYFAAFSFFFLLPHISLSTHIFSFVSFIKNRLFLFIFLITTTILTIHYTTHAHRYLLSDNRHYTFYIWKNIFQRHWCVKYTLSIVYIFCIHSLWNTVKPVNPLWKVTFISCLLLSLVPSPLLELRYFLTPLLLLRLNVSHQRTTDNLSSICLEVISHGVINTLAILVFLHKPFISPGSDQLQRFMY